MDQLRRLQTRVIAAGLYPAIASLCRTVRWTVEGAEHYDGILRTGHQPIVAFWHGRILPIAWFFRRRGIVAMTSANFDGQWTARLLEHLGNRTVAGSSSRRGMRGMLELKREVLAGHPAAFALDGPRGPALVAQPGAVWLAQQTGNPILPVHAEASRHWTLSSWDRTQVPRPFSAVAIVIGAPVQPGELDEHGIVERRLADLQQRATRLARPEGCHPAEFS
ncbi:MAG: lysophospholipid acyltransferase family protein [Acidobacteria bacterium]|nr:lysophospholipid acyltransferase family protein [Acidobacteriota bacterium]